MPDDKLNQLKAASWEYLAALPAHSQSEIEEGGRKVFESVWVDKLSADEIQIVVQRYFPRPLVSRMSAEGFQKTNQGEIRPIPAEALSEFL